MSEGLKPYQKRIATLNVGRITTLSVGRTEVHRQYSLNYLTNKIIPTHTDQCRFCEEEEETFIHLLNECPVFYNTRQELLMGETITNTPNWKPKTLLKFAKEPQIIEALLENRGEY